MNVRKFANMCEKQDELAICTIQVMSQDARSKLKANLKQKIVNCDSWNIAIQQVPFAVSVLALISSSGMQIPEDIILKLMLIFIGAVLWSCRCMWLKSKCEKALCYIEEYSNCKLIKIELCERFASACKKAGTDEVIQIKNMFEKYIEEVETSN